MNTLIIAEAGVNHNGQTDLALQLVDVAADAGADVVKFQTFKAETLVTMNAPKAKYQSVNTRSGGSQFEMLKALELTAEMHDEIIAYCKIKNIEFLSTAFDIKSLDTLVSLGSKRIKIPSGEITNLPYLEACAKFGLPIILSTGMATLQDVTKACDLLIKNGVKLDDLTVLQCTTSYPAAPDELNLRVMSTLAEATGCKVGFSDHSLGSEAAIAAVAMGACVLEKHITLNASLPGPDHRASMEPEPFKQLVNSIRNVERALGSRVKLLSEAEKANIAVARKSIVAARDIAKGEIFSVDNLTTKRPGTGISPMKWYNVLGQPAKQDFHKDDLVEI